MDLGEVQLLLYDVHEELCEVLNQTPNYEKLDQVKKRVESMLEKLAGE